MLGTVQVNNLNLIQGQLPEVENYFLFLGQGAGVNIDKLVTLDASTDLDSVLGAAESNLKTQVTAARDNAGQNWNACVLPLGAEKTWEDGVDFAMERVSVEAFAITDPLESVADLENIQTKAENIMGKYMRPVWGARATRAIGPEETWEDFQDAMRPLTQNVAADQVSPVGTFWGPELGAYMGRLANASVTVADSPMRVATGPLVGNWTERPVDSAGRVLDLSILKAFDAMRFSVPQFYPDYPGTYWADGNVLDVPGGDFQTIENLRTVQKAMRKVYPLAVARVGDRRLNQTPASIAAAQTYFMRPLREMSHSRKILGQVFPGEIEAPQDGDIVITWPAKYAVEIWMAVRPYNCPKKISCNIMLDLTNYAAAI